MNNNQNYFKFLGKLYDILIKEEIIKYDEIPKDLKEKKIRVEEYLEKLQRVQDKSLENDRYLDMIKKLYYDRYIIKEEDIPTNYLNFLERQYLEQGHGHINFVNPQNNIDLQMREQHINKIIVEQKDSLDNWLNYFLSKDSSYLPMWAKVWAFQGMLHIGNLNKNKDGYDNRSKTTINPFVSMDPEVLGKCVELITDSFNKQKITDEELDKLLSNGSFSKIYGKLLSNKKQIKTETTDGIWIKYNQEETDGYEDEYDDDYEDKYDEENDELENEVTSIEDPEYIKLYNSLQGYNTGWCTAGSRETAKEQLEEGDFYVYYSKDSNGEYKIPRLAIRMSEDEIAEIRGISENQNIEPNMEVILEEKLKEFPDAKTYKKKVSDMKKLTKIYNKYLAKEELTKEELIFIYEIDDEIEGFGYIKDPRIDEIKSKRDIKQDIRILPEILQKNRILRNITSGDGLIFPKKINYHLDLSGLKDAKGLVLPEEIKGHLDLRELTSAEGLILPKKIDGDLNLSSLKTAEGLVLPEEITGYLNLRGLESTEGLILPKDKADILNSSGLNDVKGMLLPPTKNIQEGFDLYDLRDARNLILPKEINGYLNLGGISTVEDLILPKKITGSLNLYGLREVKKLILPEYIGGYLNIENLRNAEIINMPEYVGKDIQFPTLFSRGLEVTGEIIFPSKINYELDLSGLKSIKRLEIPEGIIGCVNLEHLGFVVELILPKKIIGNLNLGWLRHADIVEFPEYIDGDVNLRSLINADGWVFPEKIEGNLDLRSIRDAKGIGLPEYVGGSLDLSGLTSAEGLILPEHIGKTLYLRDKTVFKEIVCGEIQGIKQISLSDELLSLDEINKRRYFYKNVLNYKSKSKSRGFVNSLYLTISVLLLCILAFVVALLIVT